MSKPEGNTIGFLLHPPRISDPLRFDTLFNNYPLGSDDNLHNNPPGILVFSSSMIPYDFDTLFNNNPSGTLMKPSTMIPQEFSVDTLFSTCHKVTFLFWGVWNQLASTWCTVQELRGRKIEIIVWYGQESSLSSPHLPSLWIFARFLAY